MPGQNETVRMSEGSAFLQGTFLGLILSAWAGAAVGQQCFVPGECSGILAGIADENGADSCLTSVRIRSTLHNSDLSSNYIQCA